MAIAGKTDLRMGKIQSCGCLRKELISQKRGCHLIGERFGRLVVTEQLPSKKYRTYWKCQCDCGNIIEVCARELRRGDTRSCGCLKREKAA